MLKVRASRKAAPFFKIILSLCVLLTFKSSCGAETSLERIRKAYEGIRDIKGGFIQKSHIKDLGRTDRFNGTFMIKIPDRMRWQYHGDKSSEEVIINNGVMIVYQKREKQAFKTGFDKDAYGRSPLALLGGLGEISKEFEVVRNDDRLLLLRPRAPMGGIVSVEITLSDGDFPVGSILITDKRSNTIEIALKDISVNSGLRDAAFDFSLPKGASMYDTGRPE